MAVRLVVLASGEGTNFAALADAVRDGKISNAKIEALVCNKAGAGALTKASDRGISTRLLESAGDRAKYDEALRALLKELAPDFILLAGYMKILPASLIDDYPSRIINIHPSLLPSFRGMHAIRQALEEGVRWTGVTVHFVTPELDAGPIIDQAALEVRNDDTEDSLHARLRPLEHETYVRAVGKLCTRPYELRKRKLVWLPA